MSTKIPSDLSVILQWKCNTRVLTMPLLKLSDCMGQLVIDAHNINLTFTSPDCYNKVKGENNTSHLCVISTKLFHIFPTQSHYDRWYEVLSLLFFFLTDKTGFKKLGDLPKVTPRSKWQSEDFSKSRSWDSKSHVHSTTSQQYPLQAHSCISIPKEAGQPTIWSWLNKVAQNCSLLDTPPRPEQPKSPRNN